jgi:Domain of unknown function (DUF4337)
LIDDLISTFALAAAIVACLAWRNPDLPPASNQQRYRFETRVAVTLVCIAAALLAVTVLRRIGVIEELRAKQVTTETWNLYQYKSIARQQSLSARDMFEIKGAAKQARQYAKAAESQARQLEELQQTAQAAERSRFSALQTGFRFRVSQGMLELALVLAALAIFFRPGALWAVVVVDALLGIAVAAYALWPAMRL